MVNLEIEKKKERKPFDLDKPLLWLSEKDYVTYRTGSWFITGSTGAGKSSAAIATLYKNMLADGCSCFVAITKASDTEDYIRWAHEVGRGDDIVIVEEGGHSLNIFLQEAAATQHPLDIPSNITELASQIFETSAGGQMEKDFFALAALELFRQACGLLVDANEPITLANINSIISSIPLSDGILEDKNWQSNSYCALCLGAAFGREEDMSDIERREWKGRQQYFMSNVVNMPQETRESVRATYNAYFSPLLQGSTRQLLLADEPTISPETVYSKNKIIIINAPCKTLGIAAQNLTKIAITFFLKARERFHIEKDAKGRPLIPPFAMIIDEMQLYVSPSAWPSLLSTVRSSGVIFTAATQSLSSLYEQLDSRKARYQANSIISNLPCRLVLNLSDAFTAEQYANDIGKVYTTKVNFNMNRGFGGQAAGGGSAGNSYHEEYQNMVLPLTLTSLQKINPQNGYCAAVFYAHGSIFRNGKNHIFVAFNFEGQSLALEGIKASDKSPHALKLFFQEFIGEIHKLLSGGFKTLLRIRGIK